MTIRKVLLSLAIGSVLCQPVLASYSCTGPISGVSVDNKGYLWVESIAGLDWLSLCNLTSSANGFDPAVCKAVHAQVLAAQAAGKTVTIWFEDAGTCTSHTPWQLPPNGFYFVKVNG